MLRNIPTWGRLGVVGVLFAIAIIFVAIVFRFEQDTVSEPPSIGFITLGRINDPGWNQSQYEGIKEACDSLGMKLFYKENVRENTGEVISAIRDLKGKGVKMIYLASYAYADEAITEIESSPEISFSTIVPTKELSNLTSHYVRMDQGRYMAGVLAGLRTKVNAIGYIAAEKSTETIREINAFAIGVKRVNPNAKTYVIWTGDWASPKKEREALRTLSDRYAIDIVTYHQDDQSVPRDAESLGIDYIGFNARLTPSNHYLGTVICRWDIYYKNILTRFAKGELPSVQNNWIGISEGAIWLMDVPDFIGLETGYILANVRKELEDRYPVFHGPLRDINGTLRVKEKEVYTDNALIKNMDWLVEGVEVVED